MAMQSCVNAFSASPTLKAVIYTRYSSHSQRDVSIEQQIRACQRFAEQQNIVIVDIYEDRALTGTSDRRPGFQKMIRDANRADWDYVIVYTLDRFARDRYDSAVYKRQLKNCGIKVLSAMENISDDPTGVLMESLLEGLAEYYSKELSRKIRRGMEDNALKCMANGALPLGYIRDADGRYAICEPEAALVREIYRRVRDGDMFSHIITDLNLRGCRTKTGKTWNKSSFNRLLTNPRYTGLYIYGDIRIPGGIPQIISQGLFDAVQCKLHSKSNPRSDSPSRRRRDNSVYLLTGKLYCGHCKRPMIGVSGAGRHGGVYYYYACKGSRLEHSCSKKAIRRELIELKIAEGIRTTMLNDKAIHTLAAATMEYQRQFVSNSELEALEIRLKEINQSIKNIVAAIEAGIISSATQNRLIELEREQRTVTRQITVAKEDADQLLTQEEIIATLKLFQNGDINDKAYQESLIDTFLVAAYLYDDKIKIVFNLGGTKKDAAIPFDIESVALSDDVSIDSANLHQITKGYPKRGGLFIFILGNRTELNATVRWTVAATSANTGGYNNLLHRSKCKSIPFTSTKQ